MISKRIIVLALAAFLMLSAGFTGSKSAAHQDDELFPCDPTPSQVRICQLHGGTFDFAKCRCVFP